MRQFPVLPLAAALALPLAASCLSASEPDKPLSGPVQPVYSIPLSEAGQSGIRLQGDHLYLVVHKKLQGEPRKFDEKKSSVPPRQFRSGDVVGQCFDRATGKFLWEISLPGTRQESVLLSWHDATSLTPVADEQHVVFQNSEGAIACCTRDGKLLWKRDYRKVDSASKSNQACLHDGALIVSLPCDLAGLTEDQKKYSQSLYQLHSLNLQTGTDNWISPTFSSHRNSYTIEQWKEEPVLLTISVTDAKNHSGKEIPHAEPTGYLLSLKDGKPLCTVALPPDSDPYTPNALHQGKYVIYAGGRLQFIDPESGKSVKELPVAGKLDEYYAWTGSKYESAPFSSVFTSEDSLKSNNQNTITKGTLRVVGDAAYYWRYEAPVICCLNLTTGKTIGLQVPLQGLKDKTVWKSEDFRFTPGMFNSSGLLVNSRFDTKWGNIQGGFGHVLPAKPVREGNRLYWQNAAGVVYIIDVSREFGPDAFSWKSFDPDGKDWTFGPVAVDDQFIYARSQQRLVKFPK